jgi:hypothetical protein
LSSGPLLVEQPRPKAHHALKAINPTLRFRIFSPSSPRFFSQ